MSETARQTTPNELSEIYAKLSKQDIEQFYTGYQWWNLQQRSVTLQEQIEGLQREIAANIELMELVHPPAIALATMARLQASGVKDLDLLDRMLERGEDWLDRTMQRLDYCEQFDFILDDYTQWCQNALEGAYDWIDSMREGGVSSSLEITGDTSSTEATEELLLQKLTSEEEEQSPSPEMNFEHSPSALEDWQGDPLRSPLLYTTEEPVSTAEEHVAIREEVPITEETPSSLEEAIAESQEEQLSQTVEISPFSDSPVEDSLTQESVGSPSQELVPSTPEGAVNWAPTSTPPIELNPTSDSEQSVKQELSESSIGEDSESEQLISQAYIESDSAPEDLPPVEGEDGSDFRQVPLQEQSEDAVATEEPLLTIDESPMYWEESLPYSMYPPDKQPGIEAGGLENAEQAPQIRTTSQRKRNFLQRLARIIWRR